jgi:hypothetical protein
MIKIGRHNNCEICIEDSTLSKYQAHIIYVPEKGWVLVDGYESKPSTNGTWLYISEPFEVYDGLVFKAHETVYKVGIQSNPNLNRPLFSTGPHAL